MSKKRFYFVQWCHNTRGWLDVPRMAFKKLKPANDMAKEYAKKTGAVTRVIRKPKGWKPKFPCAEDTSTGC